MPGSMTPVRFDHISKQFGQTTALDDINLEIGAGELFFLLGPSGCGKSTLLRLIAGLHEPTRGRILFNDRDVTTLGTEKRNAVMCFQSYALWPHMTVARQRPLRPERPRASAGRAGAADRRGPQARADGARSPRASPINFPAASSSAWRSRGRWRSNPDCLLLDEPLSNLDAKLRHEMRSEIRRICKTAGFTTIYVTHDQKEALSVADRIAVMKAGKLAQVGTPGGAVSPAELGSFVADFIGHTNLLPGTDRRRGTARRLVSRPRPARFDRAKADRADSPDERVIAEHSPRADADRAKAACGSAAAERNRIVGRTDRNDVPRRSERARDGVNGGQRVKVISAPPLFDVPAEMTVEFDRGGRRRVEGIVCRGRRVESRCRH